LVEARPGSNSTPVIEKCSFTDNFAYYGGGIGCFGVGAMPIIRSCVFERNRARSQGGAFYRTGPNATPYPLQVTGSRFEKNTSLNEGGALSIRGITGLIIIQQCAFNKDSAKADSGAIMVWNTEDGVVCQIEKCQFTNNFAGNRNGAVGHYCGNDIRFKATLNIKNCYFGLNMNNAVGVRVANAVGQYIIRIEQCYFEANIAFSGSAIDLQPGSINYCDALIDRCQFVGNFGKSSIDFNGGPLKGRLMVSNSRFIYNYGLVDLFGIHSTEGYIINCDFYRNNGGAFLINGSSKPPFNKIRMTILNTQIWEPMRNNASEMFTTRAEGEPPFTGYTIDYSILQYNNCTGSPACGKNMIYGQVPVEDRKENRIYYVCNPGYEKGSSIVADTFGLKTDLRGDPRKRNASVDIGAYEAVFPPPQSCTTDSYEPLAAIPGMHIHLIGNPVPAGQTVQAEVFVPWAGDYRWSLTDLYGKTIRSGIINLLASTPQPLSIDTQSIVSGLYVLLLEHADGRKRQEAKVLICQ
jgi:hypothetical protein